MNVSACQCNRVMMKLDQVNNQILLCETVFTTGRDRAQAVCLRQMVNVSLIYVPREVCIICVSSYIVSRTPHYH